MPRLGQIVEATKRLVVTFGDVELKLQYRPSAVTPRLQKAIAQAQIEGDLDALVLDPICRLIASWDLTDDDGSLIPIEPEALSDLPAAILKDLMTAIGEDMAVDPTRSGASSSTSSPTVVSAASPNGTSSS